MKREAWLLGVQLAAAFRAVSTIYQSDGVEGEYSSAEIKELVEFVVTELHVSDGRSRCFAENMGCFVTEVMSYLGQPKPQGAKT